jgi:beta-hydroxylase
MGISNSGVGRKRFRLVEPKFLLKRVVYPLAVFAPLAYFVPKLLMFYVICGFYDIARNSNLDRALVSRYFFGNGIPTWLLSPYNILMDLLTLPYINKGVYRLVDLPPAYQEEVRRLIDVAQQENLVGQMEERAKAFRRTMVFFKWYGSNVNSFLTIPAFHQQWNYVETIGVSVFSKRTSTSKHFGPLRTTLRVLYNLNDIDDASAYIVVGNRRNYWRENKLFIFDDTLMHQSFNETDDARYCLFVDIIRPTLFTPLLKFFVRLTCFVSRSFNFIFYQNWKIIEH